MHVHVIAIGLDACKERWCVKALVVEFVNAPAETQATGCAGFTFEGWLAARDPSPGSVTRDSVARVPCIMPFGSISRWCKGCSAMRCGSRSTSRDRPGASFATPALLGLICTVTERGGMEDVTVALSGHSHCFAIPRDMVAPSVKSSQCSRGALTSTYARSACCMGAGLRCSWAPVIPSFREARRARMTAGSRSVSRGSSASSRPGGIS